MKTLFIDTSLKDMSIGIISNGNVLYMNKREIMNEHSKYVLPCVKEALDVCSFNVSDINNIMVVNGPGSFTGIRVGLTIAKIYGYLLDKGIITLSSLKCLALSVSGEYIISLIDARNGNYYVGFYDKFYNEVIDEQFANISFVMSLLEKYSDVVVVSNSNIDLDFVDVLVVDYDIGCIYDYYKNDSLVNVHMVNSNYLKLPQVLEK